MTPSHHRGRGTARAGTRKILGALLSTLFVALNACGGDIFDPGHEGAEVPVAETADRTAPVVVSTTPAGGANSVSITGSIRVTFSEAVDPASISTETVTVDGLSGTVSVSGAVVTFRPAADLTFGTSYTGRVRTGVRDEAENTLENEYSWSFTTEVPPAPPMSFPLVTDTRWAYDLESTSTVCASSTGCSTRRTSAQRVLWIEEETSWQGRNAFKLVIYDFDNSPGNESGLSTTVVYISQGPDGLDKWHPKGTTGGDWRRLVSYQAMAFDNNTFLMAGGPAHGEGTTVSPGQVSVPAGSYSTLRTFHEYKKTGRYAPEDIFETRVEHYADGVGLVHASWDYSFDDNDPRGTDLMTSGSVVLRYFESGPIPDVAREAEPNDDPLQNAVQLLPMNGIVAGDVHVSDPGHVVTLDDVAANREGEKRLQDWYRVDVATSGPIRIELAFEVYNYTHSHWNDLDLYAFYRDGDGTLVRFGTSASEPGKQELLFTDNLPAGTYYFAVQAWDTPSDPVRYWLSVR